MPYTCPINGKSGPLNLSRAASPAPLPAEENMNGRTGTASTSTPPSSSATTSHTNQQRGPTKASSIATPLPSTPQKMSSFYIFNEDDNDLQENRPTRPQDRSSYSSPERPVSQPSPQLTRTSSRSKKRLAAGGISKLSFNSSEILSFPKESTHAYSYAHLSPNSLAVRLSILKRSLEIFLDRPDLMTDEKHTIGNPTSLNLDIEGFINQIHTENEMPNNKINIRSNASHAALAALFNSSTAPPSIPSSPLTPTSFKNSAMESKGNVDQTTHLGLKALINILQEDNLTDNTTDKKALARDLHDLSLTTVTNNNQLDAESQLKIRLLHSLAIPFYEPIVQTPIISLNEGVSSLALSSLEHQAATTDNGNNKNNNNNNNRVFHTVSMKNTSPQAIFTCEMNDPWNLKAANDLACLIFGVSRASLRRLTLLDMISSDSKEFVLNRLMANSITNEDIIFSGEIIAIAKTGTKLTWASLWAKRKGNLIICMFDQVPCDSVDLIVNLDTLAIESYKKVSGYNLFNQLSSMQTIDELVYHFKHFLDSKEEAAKDVPQTVLDSQLINEQRYFTIKKNNINIPCALTSKVIDENDRKLKLKIHSLPYIAGVFIISSSDYKVLSFNQSIAKNLFGLTQKQLLNKPMDKIVPKFSHIMRTVLHNFKYLKLIPGLVLPEHFFRQMNSLVEHKGEEGFLNSIGLDGKHCDGSTIKVDIQLRCSSVDTLVLWITHSRSVYRSKLEPRVDFKEGTKFSDEKSSSKQEQQTSESQQVKYDDDVHEDDKKEVTSQLSMLNENEIQSISRSSSSRSGQSNANSSSEASTRSSTSTTKLDSGIDIKGLVMTPTEESEVDLKEYKVLDHNVDEVELLKLENAAIERTKSISKDYPKKIGLKRREKSIKEFNVLKKMGQGAYGRVVLAQNKKDPNYKVVIKLIIKERILVDTWVRDRKLGTVPSEIQIMATLNNNPHPNIMRLIDFFEDDDYYYIETPPHGTTSPAIDLFDLIELKKTMTESECKSIIKQCISALNHLHNNGVVHRDIKDENLIIDSNGVIKLIDFGSAAYIKQGPFDVFVGTLDYAAPEVLNGMPYEGKPQDVWSLGVLLYTLIYKENPFYNVDEIMDGELRIPYVTSEGCLNLIKKILQRDIRKRPTMSEIVQDEWLNS